MYNPDYSSLLPQEQLRCEQQDIEQQRETLYRKLEALKAQGIILSPTLTVLTTTPPAHTIHDEHHTGRSLALSSFIITCCTKVDKARDIKRI